MEDYLICKRCGETKPDVSVIENMPAYKPGIHNPLELIFLGNNPRLCTDCIETHYTIK